MSKIDELRKLAEEVQFIEAARVEAEAAVPESKIFESEDEHKIWLRACGEVWRLGSKLIKLAPKLAAAVLDYPPQKRGMGKAHCHIHPCFTGNGYDTDWYDGRGRWTCSHLDCPTKELAKRDMRRMRRGQTRMQKKHCGHYKPEGE